MGLQDGCLGGLVLAAEDLDRHRLGVGRMNPVAWDALAGAHRDAWAGEFPESLRLAADAEKLVDPGQACLERDVLTSDGSADPAVVRSLSAELPPAVAVPDKPVAAPFAVRSSAAQAAAGETAGSARQVAMLAR